MDGKLLTESVKMKRMRTSLESVSTAYWNCENTLLGNKYQTKGTTSAGTKTSSGKTTISWGTQTEKLLIGVLEKAGLVGGIGAGTYRFVKGGIIDGKATSYVKGIKSFYSSITSAVKARKVTEDGTQATWKEVLLGLDKPLSKYADMSKLVGAKTAFTDIFKSKLNVKTQGVGWALTAVTNGISNYEEYGGMTKRAIAETVGETAVTVLEGALISAGVSAAFVALGFVGAPAVAIGAVTVAVTWGADLLCEKLTGENVAELVSDSILNFGEAVNAQMDVVKETIKKQVGTAAQNIKNGVSSLWKNAARRFSLA